MEDHTRILKVRDQVSLSIVVPCYNEEHNISLLIDELNKVLQGMHMVYEIICINDGSSDSTDAVLKELSMRHQELKFISFSRNFGKEAAMLAGLDKASGQMVVIMDADLQHPPELIPQMIEKSKEGFDQVIACRDRSGEKKIYATLARLYYVLVNHILDVSLIDGAGDFRLLSRKVVNTIISMREINRFSKGIFSWVGYKQTIIWYPNQKRNAGQSKWSFRSLMRYGMDGIVSFSSRPLNVCLYVGLLLLFLGILYLIFLFCGILCDGIDVPGYFTIIFMIIMMSGTQLVSLGVIGSYIGRIYSEIKGRPPYIIEDTNITDEK